MSRVRKVARIVEGQETMDGAGVRLKRILGTHEVMQWDPFLLLDEFKNDDPAAYLAGFPDHPHRGFETVTYMLAGNFRHRDSKGHEGHLKAGSVQWMSAGRGIIHSEMPEQEEGLVWGYQLWLNLPARLKMREPHYQDITSDQIPRMIEKGREVKVIAGEYAGQAGPGRPSTPFTYLDVHLNAATSFTYPVPHEMNSFIYVYEGTAQVGPSDSRTVVRVGQLALFDEGDVVELSAGGKGSHFLFAAAERLEEPIARRGPFVMNTREELEQAFLDYQNGTLDQ